MTVELRVERSVQRSTVATVMTINTWQSRRSSAADVAESFKLRTASRRMRARSRADTGREGRRSAGARSTRGRVVARRATQAYRFDVILDTVATVHPLDPYLRALKIKGTLCSLVLPDRLDINPITLATGRRNVSGSGAGGTVDTRAMLDFCGQHGIVAEYELITPNDLARVFERLIAGDVRYRFVLDLRNVSAWLRDRWSRSLCMATSACCSDPHRPPGRRRRSAVRILAKPLSTRDLCRCYGVGRAMLLHDATWEDIGTLRQQLGASPALSIEGAAQAFAGSWLDTFESVVLARLFLVQPLERLPQDDQAFACAVAGSSSLPPATPCLSLLGTRGREPAWNQRRQSQGHRAIPLIDQKFVRGAPMLAKLLADLDVDLQGLDDGRPIVTRRMLGGLNSAFYVRDAQNEWDAEGRAIIADRKFVAQYGVHTVFGMGGAYANGVIAIAIVFTTELLEPSVVNRYPSLIGNFKMATASLLEQNHIYGP
jgi:hypothetical protein